MTLAQGQVGTQYKITAIDAEDDELESFLFTLGCYAGEAITIVSTISNNLVVSIRDGRYNIDRNLAGVISVA